MTTAPTPALRRLPRIALEATRTGGLEHQSTHVTSSATDHGFRRELPFCGCKSPLVADAKGSLTGSRWAQGTASTALGKLKEEASRNRSQTLLTRAAPTTADHASGIRGGHALSRWGAGDAVGEFGAHPRPPPRRGLAAELRLAGGAPTSGWL
jgi:hypothetical protein